MCECEYIYIYIYTHIGGLISFASTVIFLFTLDSRIKPVLCSHMVSLFHHTSPWTHGCLQFSPSAHRNGRVFRCSVQTACCYWILNRGKSSSNWNSQTNASRLWWSACWCEYSETLGKAVQDGELGQADLSDQTRIGRPVSASDQLHQDRFEDLIRRNFVQK